MSDAASAAGGEHGGTTTEADQVTIAVATAGDVPRVGVAVAALLRELGAEPPALDGIERATQTLVDDPALGIVLVATDRDAEDGALVGVLGASWPFALHVPGRYGLIQDLWVAPAWRSRAVGWRLVRAFADHARAAGIGQIEVGLPRARFAGLPATEAFYRRNGFEIVGARMRWWLS